MERIYKISNNPIVVVVGLISTLIVIISFIYTIYLIIKGILPVIYRLGKGLSSKKIAIISDSKFDELKGLLKDSKIFNEKNIEKIELSNIKKALEIPLILAHRDYVKNNVDDLLQVKKYTDAIIIYAPQEEGFIDKEEIKKLNLQSNCTIVNFRGRLLNDILTSMITTSYEKR